MASIAELGFDDLVRTAASSHEDAKTIRTPIF